MGLFSFTQGVAIDLGTANTIITINDKIVVDEPSVVALDARTDKVLAVGKVAREMYEKTHPNIRTIRPLREGVIADFYAAEQMIRGFIKIASGRKRHQDRERSQTLVFAFVAYGDRYPFRQYGGGDPCGSRLFGTCGWT